MTSTRLAMPTEKLKEMLSYRVSATVYKGVEAVSVKERRDLSDVSRALLERGLAAYKRDGQLFEPEAPAELPAELPAEITVSSIDLGNKRARKKNTA